jgi:peptide/nickel transport system permease protein
VAVLGPSLLNVVLAIAITLLPSGALVTRGQVLTTIQNPYIEAARTLGCSSRRIMARHVIPNCFAPLIIVITVSLGTAILAESSLSFLGMGVPPPTPTWGGMLSGGARAYIVVAPWMGLAPGLAITLVILSFNVLGDALRDVLDPRLRHAG